MPLDQFRFRPSPNGGGLRTRIYPEDAAESFKYGARVMGVVREGGFPLVAAHVGDAPVLGWALGNATTYQGTPIPVLLAEGCEVLMKPEDVVAQLEIVETTDDGLVWARLPHITDRILKEGM